jgi:hypothetical protein
VLCKKNLKTRKKLNHLKNLIEKKDLEQPKKIHLYSIYILNLNRIAVPAYLRRLSDGGRQRFSISKILLWVLWNNLLKAEFALVGSCITRGGTSVQLTKSDEQVYLLGT